MIAAVSFTIWFGRCSGAFAEYARENHAQEHHMRATPLVATVELGLHFLSVGVMRI